MRSFFKYSLLFYVSIILIYCANTATTEIDYSNSSGFDIEHADSTFLENMEVLGKVWGYVKYHHPAMASDSCDIDYELFGLLPQVATTGKAQRNEILVDWIAKFGDFNEAVGLDTLNSVVYADLSWIRDTVCLGRELSSKLQRLRYAGRLVNKYAAMEKGVIKMHEEKYEAIAAPDAGYRLLSLFRFWNIIEYYFPYRNINDKDWAEVLREYIPIFAKSEPGKYKENVAMLVAEVNDGHAAWARDYVLGEMKIPVEFVAVGDKILVKTSAVLGLNPGDELIAIDDMDLMALKSKMSKYLAASNDAFLWRAMAFYASRTSKDAVVISVRNPNTGKIETYVATSVSLDKSNTAISPLANNEGGYRLLEDSTIGYVVASGYSNKNAEAILKLFANTRAIIIDMRNYPKEFMVHEFISKYFIPQRREFAILMKPYSKAPGIYRPVSQSIGRDNPAYYKGQIVVLVDNTSISQFEFTTMAWQATPNCIVVGSQTAGADGDVISSVLPGGIGFRFSGLGVYYPDMSPTQRVGVRIDIYATDDPLTPNDELLEKAIEIIKSN